MYDKKNLKGRGCNGKDDAAFLKIDRDPWEASASGQGYNGRYDDDTGAQRGAEYGFSNTSDDKAFLKRSWTGDYNDAPHQRLYELIDNQKDQPAGPLLGGGGPVSRNLPEGDSSPRYAPKSGSPSKQTNLRKPD
jgi:hypothetical protein